MVKCPKCKSERVVPIMYGKPSMNALEASARGEVIIGGCEVDVGNPDYGCLECDFRWSKELLTKDDITKLRFKIVENGPCFIDDMHKWVYEIYPNGKMIKYSYIGRNRKYINKEERYTDKEKVSPAFEFLQSLVRTRWKDEIVCDICDGCSYDLQLTYVDGRKEVHYGDVAGGTVDALLMNLIEDVFEDDERSLDEAEIESLINWWCSIDTQGMDVVKFLINPVMDALGDDIEEILKYLDSMDVDDLMVISGCFEYLYKKFTTDEVWDALGKLEAKCGI